MTTPFNPSEKSQQAINEFCRQAYSTLGQQFNIRDQIRQRDLNYMRELDYTVEHYKAKMANQRLGDPTKYDNGIFPLIMPQVESAVAYQQSVFLQGTPIFGCVSNNPNLVDAATQMDTIIGDQQVRGNWVPEIMRTLRDSFKYNIGLCEVEWARERTYEIQTSLSYKAGKEGQPVNTIWEGNKFNHWSLYNSFWDTSVDPVDIAENGEFVGKTGIMSRIALKKYIESLTEVINVQKAFESQWGGITTGGLATTGSAASYYLPLLNPDALVNINNRYAMDWTAWAGLAPPLDNKRVNINYRNIYEVTKIYARIIPKEFGFQGVPNPGHTQIWKFVIVNGQTVIYAERMTNAHNLLPVLCAVANDDGLGYQTKSFAQNLEQMQSLLSALMNSDIASRRRALSDRLLYDSSRISPAMINNDSPTAKIPVKPSAFQTDIGKAVFPFPFRDDQFQINGQQIQMYTGMANLISGLNPARQGQFVKGNKTREEFSTIMANANGRDQAVALMLEGNFFGPAKEILKANILQYQGGVSIYNPEKEMMVEVDPLVLRKAQLLFKVSDGLIPSEKLIDGEMLTQFLNVAASSPQVAQAYNIGPMFSYLLKSKGAKIQPFEKSPQQVAYEQAMGAWQQAVATIGQAALKANPPMATQQIQAMYPPQPKPQDYGFDPAKPMQPQSTQSILAQVNNATSPQAAAPQQPAGV